jgi:hypothetical protein
MSQNPPLSFDALAKTAPNPASGGYPYSLKGNDLDKNFVFATEDFSADHFEVTTTTGIGGHQQRKVALKYPLPDLPTTGTYVLGAVDGALTWLATEEC